MAEDSELQIVILSGPADAPRAVLGFATALGCLACDITVHVFLAMDGVRWVTEPSNKAVSVPGFLSVGEYISMIQEQGGTIEMCATCHDQHCAGPSAEPEIRLAGLSSLALRMTRMHNVTF